MGMVGEETMLGFVQNFFAPKANAIGVDFGSDGVRLAQVQLVEGEYQLIAAASADVPSHVQRDQGARFAFLVDALREMLPEGKFVGRQAVLGLPAASMFIQHLRMAKMDDEALRKALPWEARGKLPIDPSHAVLRHLLAGEVYSDHEQKSEVILMAAKKEMVNQFLAAAAKAKLDVIGMNVEPKALVDCFNHVYRRKTDAEITNCFVDIGGCGSRAVVTRAGQILFARNIPVGGDHFTRAVAAVMKIGVQEAKILRLQLANVQPAMDAQREKQVVVAPNAAQVAAEGESFALLNAALSDAEKKQAVGVAVAEKREATPRIIESEPVAPVMMDVAARALAAQSKLVDAACAEPLAKLIEELGLCRRYCEATFPNQPIQRLIFVGGEARQRGLCQQIAMQMGLAAQVGDPLVRMGRTCEVSPASGIDRRQPQPGWAVAIGLSMGQAPVASGRGEKA
jgi:type IV pilus assembly protein PilM